MRAATRELETGFVRSGLHPYGLPAIVGLPMTGASAGYAAWVGTEVGYG